MRIFEIVKENVNLREAAELYGIDVNRYSKALCPFHNDRHPSLYAADDHYYISASETARKKASPPPSSSRRRTTAGRSNIPTRSAKRRCI